MASRGGKPIKDANELAQGAGIDAVRGMIDGAEIVPIGRGAGEPSARKPRSRAPDTPDSGGGDGLREAIAKNRLPENCPVTPLGTSGGIYFYLDELRQIRELKPKEHEKKNLESLFGRRSDLCEKLWPRYAAKSGPDGEPIINGWKPEEAGRQLMAACADRGIWRAQGRVRGAGAHRGDYGELILHCGDKIFLDLAYREPGLIGDYVYPAAERTPRFSAAPAASADGERLMALLSTWRWARHGNGDSDYGVDPMLLLGWIGAAMVCGALEWRPAAWLTGGRGTGKSYLQKLVKMLFGRRGLLQAQNATEAYLRQLIGLSTLPIALDELEAQADNRKVQAIIELARIASSGGTIGRGGQDHNPHDFTANSAFLFSSILTPPLAPQDRSRMAMLELEEFEEGDKAPVLDPEEMAALGLAIRRRMVDGWDRLPETIEGYKKWLAAYGHDARMQDQFGTLLACADLCLFDHLSPDEYLQRWAERLDARHLAEKAEDESEGELAARHIATSQLQAVGGAEPLTLALFILRGLGTGAAIEEGSGADKARQRLEMTGLKLVSSWLVQEGGETKRRIGPPMKGVDGRDLYVAVANRHRGLDQLFSRPEPTRWQGGVWSQALRRLKGAIAKHNVRIGGRNEWCVLVPIEVFVSLESEGEGT